MNKKKYILASVVAYAWIMLFETMFHGTCLKGLYEQTPHLWRPDGEMVVWAMISAQVLFPFLMGLLFLRQANSDSCCSGVKFGLLIGLLLIPSNLVWYGVQPLPMRLIVWWSLGGLLEMAVAGGLWAKVYSGGCKKKNPECDELL